MDGHAWMVINVRMQRAIIHRWQATDDHTWLDIHGHTLIAVYYAWKYIRRWAIVDGQPPKAIHRLA